MTHGVLMCIASGLAAGVAVLGGFLMARLEKDVAKHSPAWWFVALAAISAAFLVFALINVLRCEGNKLHEQRERFEDKVIAAEYREKNR